MRRGKEEEEGQRDIDTVGRNRNRNIMQNVYAERGIRGEEGKGEGGRKCVYLLPRRRRREKAGGRGGRSREKGTRWAESGYISTDTETTT